MGGRSFIPPFDYSPLDGSLAFVFAFFSPPRFPGTLDVALWDHEGPTARTRTYSRELGSIPCPQSSDSMTTETDLPGRPWTGRRRL